MSLGRRYRGTLDETVAFEGTKFVGKGSATVKVHPSEREGIWFKTPWGEIPYDKKHIKPHKMGFSHILTVAHNPHGHGGWSDISVLVPEHLRSALYLAGIDNAVVEVSGRVIEENQPTLSKMIFGTVPNNWPATSMPILGGAVETMYKKLINSRIETTQKRETYRVTRSTSVQNPHGVIEVFPADTFHIIVEGMQNDKYRLEPKRFELEDVYQEAKNHTRARGLSRPPGLLVTIAKQLAKETYSLFEGFLGEDSYLRIKQGMSQKEKEERMLPQYREKRNEPLAHMAISDMLGEITTYFPGNISGKFVFHNLGGGHTGRLQAFNEIEKRRVITSENRRI